METPSISPQAQESAQPSAASTEAIEVKTASSGIDSQPQAAADPASDEPKHDDSAIPSADPSPAPSEAPEEHSHSHGIPISAMGDRVFDTAGKEPLDVLDLGGLVTDAVDHNHAIATMDFVRSKIVTVKPTVIDVNDVDAGIALPSQPVLTLEDRVLILEKELERLREVLLHHGIRGPQ